VAAETAARARCIALERTARPANTTAARLWRAMRDAAFIY
jgi:hypothetical protein